MPQLEFIDCQNCGKRIAKTAKRCHHCRREQALHPLLEFDDADSHHASVYGGHDVAEDDFDYDEFLAEEFADYKHTSFRSNRWKYVSILLLIVFALLFLIPFL